MAAFRCLMLCLCGLAAGCKSPSRVLLEAPLSGVPLRMKTWDGKHLGLANGSSWSIQPIGQEATIRWMPGDPIAVHRRGHPIYPFVLTNTRTGSSVLGRPG